MVKIVPNPDHKAFEKIHDHSSTFSQAMAIKTPLKP